MIDTSLNKRYRANKGFDSDFSPIPEGEYNVRIKEVSPWTETKKTIKVILRDEDGKALKNDKGENLTELVKDCVYYNCNVKLEVVGGEYDGRLIFHNLSTHPNMPFSIPNFLYGIGMDELTAAEVNKTVGTECIAKVVIDSYDKKVVNKDTGLEETVQRTKNAVKSFKPIADDELDADLGI